MKREKFLEVNTGTVPFLLSSPHGGYKRPKNIPDKKDGYHNPDLRTYFLAKVIISELKKRNMDIYYVLSKMHRSKVDLNRPPKTKVAYDLSSPRASEFFSAFHEQLDDKVEECIKKFGKCVFIDLHGFTRPHDDYPDIIFGIVFGKTLKVKLNSTSQIDERFWGFEGIKDELSKHFTLDDGLGFNKYNLSYSGGYITSKYHNKDRVNALQIEVAKYIRLNDVLCKQFVNSLVIGMIKCSKQKM